MKHLFILFFLFSCLLQRETDIIYKDEEGNVESRYMPSYFKSDYQAQQANNKKNKNNFEDIEESNDFENQEQLQMNKQPVIEEDTEKSVEKIVLVEEGDSLLYFSRKYNTTVEAIAKLNNIKKPYRIYVGQKLKIRTNTSKIKGNNINENDFKVITVQPDDSLLEIAVKNNMSLREVAELNNIQSPYTIYVGQKIKVYTNGKKATNKNLISAKKNNQNFKNSNVNGSYYVVESGDNIFYIAKKFNTTANKIIKANNLKKPYNIYVGQKLIINNANSENNNLQNNDNTKNINNNSKENKTTVVSIENNSNTLKNDNNFIMPINGGEIIRKFGQQYDGKTFDGILFKADKGTDIIASEDGEIIYASNELKDLGNVVIIKHKNKWLSIYGHCDNIKVKVKSFVRQGEVIATVGNSGKADEPQLYFAIRRVRTAVDPLKYINNK